MKHSTAYMIMAGLALKDLAGLIPPERVPPRVLDEIDLEAEQRRIDAAQAKRDRKNAKRLTHQPIRSGKL